MLQMQPTDSTAPRERRNPSKEEENKTGKLRLNGGMKGF